MLTTPTLVGGESCETGPDDVTVVGFTTGAYNNFQAPSLESIGKVNSARSILNGQANRPTLSQAVKYLKIKNIWRPRLSTGNTTNTRSQICGIAWAQAKYLRNDGIILGFQMSVGKSIQALGKIQAMADDPEVAEK
ncbi:hypothetical protein BOTNAR_0720g00020 [Botryotinia narcissicola]|uniref:Uncharacterized protein n=1 Tax=Botryotinia narcissicola TaxID=278944 RepID=A0A4Z1HIT9_9HELO|nr:hypothetical protein BOTNAR_0720g00020 [Botryotinia narcissicola]